MEYKLFDSEIKVMDYIWEKGPISAKELSLLAAGEIGWNKNTTYTVLKKLVAKGYIQRSDPGFICTALIDRQEVIRAEADRLVNKWFAGSKKALFSALLDGDSLSQAEIDELRDMIEKR